MEWPDLDTEIKTTNLKNVSDLLGPISPLSVHLSHECACPVCDRILWQGLICECKPPYSEGVFDALAELSRPICGMGTILNAFSELTDP